jgi:hypothetical protein
MGSGVDMPILITPKLVLEELDGGWLPITDPPAFAKC